MNAVKKIILGLIILIVPGGTALAAYLIKKRYDQHKQHESEDETHSEQDTHQ